MWSMKTNLLYRPHIEVHLNLLNQIAYLTVLISQDPAFSYYSIEESPYWF